MKKIFSVLLVISFMYFAFQWESTTAMAAGNESDFTIQNNYTGVKIVGYKGTSKKVVIPTTIAKKEVTEIDSYAFSNKGLVSVTIPNTVTYIGYASFKGNKLTEVIIPSSVRTIDPYAFQDNVLEKIELNEGIILIDGGAFANNQLKEIRLPSSLDSVESHSFENNKLTKVFLSKGTTKIKASAFANNQLKEVTIPSSVETIEEYAFASNQLTKVILKEGINKLESSVFSNNQLTEVTIPSNVKTIESDAFANNKLTKVILREGVTKLEIAAFANNKIEVITIPKSMKTVETRAFEKNPLEKVIFKGAFKGEYYSFDPKASTTNFGGWYTDKEFKKKWNNLVTAPSIIYGKWQTTIAVKKLSIDNRGKSETVFKNLEEGFTYTIYKDAQLKKKIKVFKAKDTMQTITLKQIGEKAGTFYVVVSHERDASKAKRKTYTTSFERKDITIKYGKKQSMIQLKNLTKGTKYSIYKDTKKKKEIATFIANGKIKTIKTKQLSKKIGEFYITAQKPQYSVSGLTVACYPNGKGFLCPKSPVPNGAKMTDRGKGFVKYTYKKTLPDGGRITEIVYYSDDYGKRITVSGIDKRGDLFILKKKQNKDLLFPVGGGIPLLTKPGLEKVLDVAKPFEKAFK